MNKSDKVALAILGGVALVVAGNSLPPKIREGLLAALKTWAFNVFDVPPPVQFGIEALESRANTPAREPDLIEDVTGQPYWVRLPEDPIGETRYIGTMISTEEVPAEEAPEMQSATPATSTFCLLPTDTLIGVSGQSEVSYVGGLVQVVWTKDGPRPHIDKDGIIRIHVVTSTGCA